MNVYDGAELNEIGARYWLAMGRWTADEAALLLNAIDPRRLAVWANVTCGKLDVAFPIHFNDQRKLITEAFETKVIPTPATPSAVIAWAMGIGLRLPAPLIPAGMVAKGGQWVKQGTPIAQEAATPEQGKRWTTAFTDEVRAYRAKHTEKQTAEKYGVSGALIRRKLAAPKKAKAQPFSGLGSRAK